MVFQCAMVDARRKPYSNQTPVRQVHRREEADVFALEALDAQKAITDWNKSYQHGVSLSWS